jgi:hypothetical protein
LDEIMSNEAREPHLFDDATEAELLGMSIEDLLDYSRTRGWAIKRSNKAAFVAKILEKRATETLPMDESKPEATEGDEDSEDTPEQISPAEAQKLDGASDSTIVDWLERHPDARQCLIDYANLVLTRRAEARRAEEEAEALRSDLHYFVVVKGGRIAMHGLWTTLPNGSAVTAATHNLDELRAQGIVLEPVARVRTDVNQVGLSITAIDLV